MGENRKGKPVRVRRGPATVKGSHPVLRHWLVGREGTGGGEPEPGDLLVHVFGGVLTTDGPGHRLLCEKPAFGPLR